MKVVLGWPLGREPYGVGMFRKCLVLPFGRAIRKQKLLWIKSVVRKRPGSFVVRIPRPSAAATRLCCGETGQAFDEFSKSAAGVGAYFASFAR